MTAKDLKNALLQEAVQGKLVPQIASEGNARDLLEEIRKARLSHGLDFANAKSKKKGKKETELAGSNPCDISEDEIPFDITESLCWCRLSEYVDIRDGTHDSPKYVDKGYPFITSKNLQNGKLDFNNVKYISEEDHKKICARSNVETGDILYSMIGGNIGKPVMVIKDREFSIKNVALFKPYTKTTYIKYILFYLDAITEELRKIASGGCQPFVGLNVFRNWIFPLPPLAEQKWNSQSKRRRICTELLE